MGCCVGKKNTLVSEKTPLKEDAGRDSKQPTESASQSTPQTTNDTNGEQSFDWDSFWVKEENRLKSNK